MTTGLLIPNTNIKPVVLEPPTPGVPLEKSKGKRHKGESDDEESGSGLDEEEAQPVKKPKSGCLLDSCVLWVCCVLWVGSVLDHVEVQLVKKPQSTCSACAVCFRCVHVECE